MTNTQTTTSYINPHSIDQRKKQAIELIMSATTILIVLSIITYYSVREAMSTYNYWAHTGHISTGDGYILLLIGFSVFKIVSIIEKEQAEIRSMTLRNKYDAWRK